jgi:AcrR family transcriptional regulator
MPHVLKPVEHRQRRDTFLDAAQRLVQTKGYERMTVQDVLDDVGTSKGAFYHYSDSKQALLEA